jgi:hypothetical protein
MGSLRREIQALETTERVIARLLIDSDREETISELIAAIEQDRAELLAAIVGGHARHREPRRIRKPVEQKGKPESSTARVLDRPRIARGAAAFSRDSLGGPLAV